VVVFEEVAVSRNRRREQQEAGSSPSAVPNIIFARRDELDKKVGRTISVVVRQGNELSRLFIFRLRNRSETTRPRPRRAQSSRFSLSDSLSGTVVSMLPLCKVPTCRQLQLTPTAAWCSVRPPFRLANWRGQVIFSESPAVNPPMRCSCECWAAGPTWPELSWRVRLKRFSTALFPIGGLRLIVRCGFRNLSYKFPPSPFEGTISGVSGPSTSRLRIRSWPLGEACRRKAVFPTRPSHVGQHGKQADDLKLFAKGPGVDVPATHPPRTAWSIIMKVTTPPQQRCAEKTCISCFGHHRHTDRKHGEYQHRQARRIVS